VSLLPAALRRALDGLAEGRDRGDLSRRSAAISAGYRARRGSDGAILTADDALAYALARMPATYAAVAEALGRFAEAHPDFAPRTLLDAGSGPGSASFAAAAAFSSLSRFALVDRNGPLLALAATLAASALPDGGASVRAVELLGGDDLPEADLVIASYVLAETPASAQTDMALRLWRAAGRALLIVEPGTPDGFRRLRDIRNTLISAGAHVAAPCTHANACPMIGEDWCRFLARVQRTRDHKLLKRGARPFEDEPYAYLAFTRDPPTARPGRRIVGRPIDAKAGVTLDLCGPEGRTQLAVASRDRPRYKEASRLRWGDAMD